MSQWVDMFGLRDAQAEAVTARGRDVLVSAGAGSGKTRTLVARYLSLLDEGHSPRGLAAITFTEKAAREMRNRIRRAIYDWRAGACPPDQRARWEAIEAEIDTARIGTLHALCAAILRAHPAEAAIDPRFNVLEEGLAAALRAQAVDEAMNWAIGQPELQPLFAAFESTSLSRLLSQLMAASLDAQQALATPDVAGRWASQIRSALSAFVGSDPVRAAVTSLQALESSSQLMADAGDRLAEQVHGLLREWTSLETQLAGDTTSAALCTLFRIRRNYCGGAVGKKGIAREAVKTIREFYDETLHPWLGGKGKNDPQPDPNAEANAAALLPLITQLLKRALWVYQAARDQRQALDFDDLESKTVSLIERPEIRALWQKQIGALMVDEFQDTNARQRRLVEALAGTPEGASGRLFVVGDAKQSIYRFRGADVAVFREIEQAIDQRGGLPLLLDRTYRAHAGLVDAVNEMMAAVMGEGETESQAEPYHVPFIPLRAHRPESDARLTGPYVEFLCGLGENSGQARPVTAQLLAGRLSQLQTDNSIRWDDVALLFRASTGFPHYEAALEAAGIPFVTVAGRGFYHRPEIRDVLNILHALLDPWDDLALAGALRSPAFGLSDAALYCLRWPAAREAAEPRNLHRALHGDLALLSEPDRSLAVRARDVLARLRRWVDRVPAAELLKALLDETHYPAILAGHPHGSRLRRNLNKLLADAHASKLVRLSEFLEYLETLRDVGAREGEAPTDAGGAVRLMTVHKAKGLEFPVVVLADAAYSTRGHAGEILLTRELGLVPAPTQWESKPNIFRLAGQIDAAQEEAEEARLLYVAATRAREKLIVSGHLTARSDRCWLAQLARAAGVDLDPVSQQPANARTATLKCGQSISVLVSKTAGVTTPAPAAEPGAPESQAASLFTTAEAVRSAGGDESARRRIRRVTGRFGYPDSTIVGRLVHEAIRRWRFPGDPGFDRLLSASLKSLGLVDTEQAAEHLMRAGELLERLRSDARWAELDSAQRAGNAHHEVPYSLVWDGQSISGFIDLVYRDSSGAWQVVDFKTDALPDDTALRAAQNRYASQTRSYAAVTGQLLSRGVTPMLCFLDARGEVLWASTTG